MLVGAVDIEFGRSSIPRDEVSAPAAPALVSVVDAGSAEEAGAEVSSSLRTEVEAVKSATVGVGPDFFFPLPFID